MRTRFAIPFVFSVFGMFSEISHASEQSQDIKDRYLLHAAARGIKTSFQDAVKQGASLYAKDDKGLPAIALAIINDKLLFLKWLLSEEVVENTTPSNVEVPVNTLVTNEETNSPRKTVHRARSLANLKGRTGSKEKIKEPEVQAEPAKVRVRREPIPIPKAYNLSKEIRDSLLKVKVPTFGNCLHMAAEHGSPEMLDFLYNSFPEEIRFDYLTEQNEKGETPLMVAERAHKDANWYWIAKIYFEYGRSNVNRRDMEKPRYERFHEEVEMLRRLLVPK